MTRRSSYDTDLTDSEWDAMDENWLEHAFAYVAVPSKGIRGPLTPIRAAFDAEMRDLENGFRILLHGRIGRVVSRKRPATIREEFLTGQRTAHIARQKKRHVCDIVRLNAIDAGISCRNFS